MCLREGEGGRKGERKGEGEERGESTIVIAFLKHPQSVTRRGKSIGTGSLVPSFSMLHAKHGGA